MTRVYWQAARRGQNLMLVNDETGREQSIGGFREASQEFDAYVTTAEYDPRNSKNSFTDVEDAKAFVESFRSWELYSAEGTEVEPEVRPACNRSQHAEGGESRQVPSATNQLPQGTHQTDGHHDHPGDAVSWRNRGSNCDQPSRPLRLTQAPVKWI